MHQHRKIRCIKIENIDRQKEKQRKIDGEMESDSCNKLDPSAQINDFAPPQKCNHKRKQLCVLVVTQNRTHQNCDFPMSPPARRSVGP